MVWARKKDTSEEMSYLVDYYDKLSNIMEAIRALNRGALGIQGQYESAQM